MSVTWIEKKKRLGKKKYRAPQKWRNQHEVTNEFISFRGTFDKLDSVPSGVLKRLSRASGDAVAGGKQNRMLS